MILGCSGSYLGFGAYNGYLLLFGFILSGCEYGSSSSGDARRLLGTLLRFPQTANRWICGSSWSGASAHGISFDKRELRSLYY